jgi:hypothetical protein
LALLLTCALKLVILLLQIQGIYEDVPISCTDCSELDLGGMSAYQLRMAIEKSTPALNTLPYTFEPNIADDPLGCFEMWLNKQASTAANVVKTKLHDVKAKAGAVAGEPRLFQLHNGVPPHACYAYGNKQRFCCVFVCLIVQVIIRRVYTVC